MSAGSPDIIGRLAGSGERPRPEGMFRCALSDTSHKVTSRSRRRFRLVRRPKLPRPKWVVLIALVLAALWWVLDASIQSLVYGETTFGTALLQGTSPHTWLHRLVGVVMLLGFGALTAWMVHHLHRARRYAAHLNSVLAAIRRVNQLITRETDETRLLAEACRLIAEGRGWTNAWIGHIDDGRLIDTYHAGFDGGFEPMQAMLAAGRRPACVRRALDSGELQIVTDPAVDCPDCPIPDRCEAEAGMTALLRHGEQTFGWLTIICPERYATDADEQDLLGELADDIAFALHSLQAQRTAHQREAHFRGVFDTSVDAILVFDMAGAIAAANPAACRLYGYTSEEMTHLSGRDIVHPDYYHLFEDFRRQLRTTGEFHAESRDVRKDGTPFDVEVRGSTFMYRNEPHLMAIVRDITDRKRTEQAARQREQFLQDVFDAIRDGLSVLDRDLTIIRTNQQLKEVHSDQLPLEGKKCYAVFQHRDSPCPWCPTLKTFETGTAQTAEVAHPRSNGRQGWADLSVYPLTNERGEVVRAIEYVRDITERKEAQQALHASEERFRRAVAEAPFPIMLHAEDGEVLTVNKAWTQISGYAHAEIPTMAAWTERAYVEQKEAVRADIERLFELDQRIDEGEYTITCRDGTRRVWDFSSAPLPPLPDGRRQVISMAADVTGRKGAEGELAARNAEMERFVYTVSHDLRSPLITIRGFLGHLAEDAEAGDAERLRDDVGRITAAADHMNELLNGLLELSRVGRVANPTESVNLAALVEEVLASLAGVLAPEGSDAPPVAVDVADDLPTVLGDRRRLFEVYQNLIENAVRFMGPQSAPRIEIGIRRRDGAAQFYVRDNGIGIEPKYAEAIFDLFGKLDADSPGAGVGLPIVQRIVEVHGGRIWIESDGPGTGATFYFTLAEMQEAD
ncbi:MAG: PAS domain S-box protein [Phycisphaerae bacterium]|nr:PAS domain S-box protein [Phycisphaerae bacterium]